jgi:hypothetical protein
MELMLRFCDSRVPRSRELGRPRALFSGHLLLYGRDVRLVGRSFCGSIDGSARVVSDSFTRPKEAASGNSKRARYNEYRGKSFHLAKSLRRKRVIASESSPARGDTSFFQTASGCHRVMQGYGHT